METARCLCATAKLSKRLEPARACSPRRRGELEENAEKKSQLTLARQFQLPLLEPLQSGLVFLVESREPGPIVPEDKQREKGNREKVVSGDREHNHPQEVCAHREFGIRQ